MEAGERDRRYMEAALKEARAAAEQDEVPVGCVIVHGERIIARAHNQTRLLKDATAHAEMVAITQAGNALGSERLTEAELYVTVEPCAMCVGGMLWARVGRVVFGAGDAKAGACGSVVDLPANERLNHHLSVTSGVLADEAKALLGGFFAALRRRDRGDRPSGDVAAGEAA